MTTDTDVLAISDELKEFVVSNFMPGDPVDGLHNDDLLLESGIIDSASVMMLVLYLEEHFGIEILDEELFAENFATIDCMASFVARKMAM